MNVSKAWSALCAPDYLLMRRVNRWQAPRWIRWWMLAAALAATTGILLFLTLKNAVGRTRPCGIEPHCWAHLLPPDRFSFPSGHTITAFAVAISVDHYYPAAEPALLFCAVSIAASRILLGMHFLSDVVAGAILGAVLGSGSVWLLTSW